MSSVPSRHPLLVLVSVFGSFAGGPGLGLLVASWVAPGSELAQIVSPLAYVTAFVCGLMLWFGVGVVALIGNAVRRLSSGEHRRRPSSQTEVPAGYGVFLPSAVGFGLLAGVVVGLLPQSQSFWLSCAAHVAAGMAYGVLLRALARNGYLPFPEPS